MSSPVCASEEEMQSVAQFVSAICHAYNSHCIFDDFRNRMLATGYYGYAHASTHTQPGRDLHFPRSASNHAPVLAYSDISHTQHSASSDIGSWVRIDQALVTADCYADVLLHIITLDGRELEDSTVHMQAKRRISGSVVTAEPLGKRRRDSTNDVQIQHTINLTSPARATAAAADVVMSLRTNMVVDVPVHHRIINTEQTPPSLIRAHDTEARSASAHTRTDTNTYPVNIRGDRSNSVVRRNLSRREMAYLDVMLNVLRFELLSFVVPPDELLGTVYKFALALVQNDIKCKLLHCHTYKHSSNSKDSPPSQDTLDHAPRSPEFCVQLLDVILAALQDSVVQILGFSSVAFLLQLLRTFVTGLAGELRITCGTECSGIRAQPEPHVHVSNASTPLSDDRTSPIARFFTAPLDTRMCDGDRAAFAIPANSRSATSAKCSRSIVVVQDYREILLQSAKVCTKIVETAMQTPVAVRTLAEEVLIVIKGLLQVVDVRKHESHLGKPVCDHANHTAKLYAKGLCDSTEMQKEPSGICPAAAASSSHTDKSHTHTSTNKSNVPMLRRERRLAFCAAEYIAVCIQRGIDSPGMHEHTAQRLCLRMGLDARRLKKTEFKSGQGIGAPDRTLNNPPEGVALVLELYKLVHPSETRALFRCLRRAGVQLASDSCSDNNRRNLSHGTSSVQAQSLPRAINAYSPVTMRLFGVSVTPRLIRLLYAISHDQRIPSASSRAYNTSSACVAKDTHSTECTDCHVENDLPSLEHDERLSEKPSFALVKKQLIALRNRYERQFAVCLAGDAVQYNNLHDRAIECSGDDGWLDSLDMRERMLLTTQTVKLVCECPSTLLPRAVGGLALLVAYYAAVAKRTSHTSTNTRNSKHSELNTQTTHTNITIDKTGRNTHVRERPRSADSDQNKDSVMQIPCFIGNEDRQADTVMEEPHSTATTHSEMEHLCEALMMAFENAGSLWQLFICCCACLEAQERGSDIRVHKQCCLPVGGAGSDSKCDYHNMRSKLGQPLDRDRNIHDTDSHFHTQLCCCGEVGSLTSDVAPHRPWLLVLGIVVAGLEDILIVLPPSLRSRMWYTLAQGYSTVCEQAV
ncbi:hypothetical protein SARC_06770 [Sphaeroforma arctica JP610]|uniref:Uncharacterized protein n=1 Tax=Sphaeroforma arctica JP610 TaxID=667725 RepID=A0A0L0FWC3_9EUKA|nr:hypothetical protein SARC_06770 [Sphaeroforma arctica JP610]KNC80871.1 hypothetical protein SARC_06770 [Sphaeroforma arctica JP610]|eukprot:XP_014154773.1 hypothetical protein SARC_06770 [Sphaeroforma arctica JP610]